jgi:hypothetical protein
MLYLVGLGLSDETDITVKGLEVAKNASRVYLEAYTSILLVDQSVLVCANKSCHEGSLTFNRRLTMGDPLPLRTARWSNQTVKRFFEMPRTKM